MEKRGSALPKILLAVAAISISALGPGPSLLQAQRVRRQAVPPGGVAGENVDEDAGPGNFAAPNRNVLQALNRAEKVLKEHRYGEALEGLSLVLRSNEDSLYPPDRKLPFYKGLKAKAQQLLGQMPPEGRDLYEVRNGAEARDRLNRAVAAGDAAGLSAISAQLFHTQAGYEATYLLALYQMDHGEPLAGALTLKRIREAGAAAETFEPGLSLTQAACYYQAGMPGDCQQVLVDLKQRWGKPRLQLADREAAWFERDGDAPEWLAKLTGLQHNAAATETDRWAMFRGDPSRNALTVGGVPLLTFRWQVPVTDDPTLKPALLQLENEYRERGVALFSGLHPLAIGDKILMRTATNVLAVDFQTGKRIWQTEERPPEEDAANMRSNRFNGMWIGGRFGNMSQPAQYGQRIWDDAAYGTLSSDGSRVFVIEELPLGVTPQYGGFMMGGGRNDPSTRGVTNKLAAYDIHGDGNAKSGGKLVWELGGQDALQPSDAFFLGPPLPLRGQLYVMAEVKEEIRLLALDAATGKELWKQQLAMVESNITQDPIRRLAGVSPSYSDGVLICPTGSGCVVAVDLATHSLRWGYIYSHPGETAQTRRMRGFGFPGGFNNGNGPNIPRWLDGTATIVNGRVLITPPETDALYCLNLADGTPAWDPQPRAEHGEHGEQFEHFYIACVHKGVVVLVGRNSIDAINLDNGKKAWGGRTVNLPSGASVCGHGCYAGNQYLVPLGEPGTPGRGEVVSVDLESGKVLATVKSRPGTMSGSVYPWSRSAVPGNLICYRGRVISQGLEGLELYYQADAAREEVTRRLAANPDDVEGLTLRGEMLLDAGKSAEAVADFRRAYNLDKKSESHGRTRELLRDALLAGLQDDFVAHRSMADEVEPLLDDAGQRAIYLRAMATGFHRTGDWQQAIDYYLKLVNLEEAKPALEKVDRSYLVRRDRWVQARLGLLRSEGGAAAAAQIDRLLGPRLEEAKLDTSFDGLHRFLGFFGNQPQAAAARAELLSRLTQAKRILEAELLMATTVPVSTGDVAADRKAQAGLLADMALLNFRADRASDAAACFRQLHEEFGDVPCHEGKTSDQWLASFSEGDAHGREALRQELDRKDPAWPVGEVEASKPGGGQNPLMNGPRSDMLFGGPSGPFFTDSSVGFEANRQEVSLRDGLGRPQKKIQLIANGRVFGVFFNQYSTLARCCGHLLLMSVGTNICALDPWRASGSDPSGKQGSPILWRHDLSDTANENGGNMIVFNNGGNPDFRANPFGPVNARYVCYQRKRSIVAVDPVSGDQLWVRQDIPFGSDIFGDEQYVFVLSPGSNEASVYRAIDGELLGTRKVPRPKSENADDPFSGERVASSAFTNGRCPTRKLISGADISSPGAGRRGRAQYPGCGLRPRADDVRSLAAKAGLALAQVCRGGPRLGGRQRGGGRAGAGRAFRPAGPGRRPHDRRCATGGPAALSRDGPRRHADGRPVHRRGRRQPSAGQQQ